MADIPSTQHRPPPESLEHYAKASRDRDKALAAAYDSGGFSKKSIAEHFVLHGSMVSRIVKRERDPLQNT